MRLFLLSSLLLPVSALLAQTRALTPADWDLWKSVHGVEISSDGRWVAYSTPPQVGDGELVVRATDGPAEFRVPRGFIGRPQTQPAVDSAWTPPPPQFSADGRVVAALTWPPKAEFDRARGKGARGATPKASLAIVSLPAGAVTTVANVKSFRMPRHRGAVLAYLLEPDTAVRRDSASRDSAAAALPAAAATPGQTARPVAATDSARGRRPKRELGSTLVLRDLSSGAETRIERVASYAFDDSGRVLIYSVVAPDSTTDGVYLRTLADGRMRALASGPGNYRQIVLDRAGRQVAFLSDRDESSREKPRHAIYHATVAGGAARPVLTAAAVDSFLISDRRLGFTREGTAIVFGVAPPPLDSIPADSLADKAVFDLWHWRDARLQPQQRVEAGRDRTRSFTSVHHLREKRWTRIGSDTFSRVEVSPDGRHALATTTVPYSVEAMWGEGGVDAYLVDALSGARRRIAARLNEQSAVQLAPGGRYVIHFDSSAWRATATATGRTVNLTAALAGIRFDQETWDRPSTPEPWGIGGWTRGDRSVLIYDRYDVWEFDPSGGRAPRNVTDSVGRRERLVFRIVDLDPDDPALDLDESLLLRTVNEETFASGFYRDRLGASDRPSRVLMADRSHGVPKRSRDGSRWVVTRTTFREFGDLWAGPRLDSLHRISDVNPQQKDYRWGTAELVSWRSADGVPLRGILFKPDGFDPSKQYPMVVYFYERHSPTLHQYIPPFGRNVIIPTHYVSNGYLVFEPDIEYTTGYPGPSALKSIVPGVQMLIARGFVDPKAIGIQGQSWGGYQTAYIITQTNLFAAAMAGAPVANMTSAYGGIRGESGLARPFQYEKEQSRIGGSLWAYPWRYIENSPLFHADRIRTPLLIMHNDNDGAVPWQQGIELFVALRRLGKEVYLLNYNGDGHNPRKRANQKDVALRMEQFFDHHLRGKPAPDWMTRGIPFLEKGRDQLRAEP